MTQPPSHHAGSRWRRHRSLAHRSLHCHPIPSRHHSTVDPSPIHHHLHPHQTIAGSATLSTVPSLVVIRWEIRYRASTFFVSSSCGALRVTSCRCSLVRPHFRSKCQPNSSGKANTMLLQLLVQLRMVAQASSEVQSSHQSHWPAALWYRIRRSKSLMMESKAEVFSQSSRLKASTSLQAEP